MTIPIELTPEYQAEVAKWRRTRGYEPQHDQVVRILAKKELRERLRRLFDEFKITYNTSAKEFREAAKEVSQIPIRAETSEDTERAED